MDADSWNVRLTSIRHQLTPHSRSEVLLGFDELDGEYDSREEFACPFCMEDFDLVGFCCHVEEEHPIESKRGVCPVCAEMVGMGMVVHITTQHASIFKMQKKRRSRKGLSGSFSKLSLLRKELKEGHLQSLLGGSSYVVSSSSAEPDPLLSSFISTSPVVDVSKSVQPHASDGGNLIKKNSKKKVGKRIEPSPVSDKDQKEKARKCEFMQQLMFSTMLDDSL